MNPSWGLSIGRVVIVCKEISQIVALQFLSRSLPIYLFLKLWIPSGTPVFVEGFRIEQLESTLVYIRMSAL